MKLPAAPLCGVYANANKPSGKSSIWFLIYVDIFIRIPLSGILIKNSFSALSAALR